MILEVNGKIISGEAPQVIDVAIANLATGDPLAGDYQPADLETVRVWALDTVVDYTRVRREAYLTPGKAMVYEQKQREVRRYDAGERDPANLPYMARRATRLSQTPLQVRDTWKARMDAIEVADLDTEDAYEVTIEATESAVLIDEIKTALVAFLE